MNNSTVWAVGTISIVLGLAALGISLDANKANGPPKDQMLQCDDLSTKDDKVFHTMYMHCEVWTFGDKPQGVGWHNQHCDERNIRFNATTGEYTCNQ